MGKKSVVFWAAILTLTAMACKRNLVQKLPPAPVYSDSTQNLKTVLSGSSLHIFYAALQMTGMDTLLSGTTPLTLFAPTDSAFTTAGITMTTLVGFPVDSLSALLRYHLVKGNLTDDGLTTAIGNVQVNTLLTSRAFDSVNGYSAYQYNLFIKKDQVLYINGIPVNTGADALPASNGYLFSIDTVLIPPTQTVYQILQSRPELSMYYTACVLNDSVYQSQGNGPMDAPLFTSVGYNTPMQQHPVTLLAPVNSAFAHTAAPLHTIDQLRHYADSAGDPTGFTSFTALDEVVRNHLVGNQQYELFYNDLLNLPGINNGTYNITQTYYTDPNTYNTINYYVQFGQQNNAVSIYWGGTSETGLSPSGPFPFGPAHIIPSGRNIIAINGVIHEVDSLFYAQ